MTLRRSKVVVFFALASLVSATLATQLPLSPITNDAFVHNATSKSELLDDSFDAWLHELISEWGMKGLSIAVVRRKSDGDWDVETKGYGVKNTVGDPVTEDTLMPINSNSKLFTTIALGLLIEDSNNTIQWNTKVSDVLHDDWVLQDPIAQSRADYIDLISHRTGLPRHDLGWRRGSKARDAVRQLRYLTPSAEFRQAYQYNNWMYMAIAETVKRVSGARFEDFVTKRVIKRLPFKSTTYNATQAELSGQMGEGFSMVDRNVSSGGQGWMKSVYKATRLFLHAVQDISAGPGGVIMSATDAAVWLQTLLLEGRNPETNEQIIPESIIRKAASGVSVAKGTTIDPEVSVVVYGGGQDSYSYQGHNIVEHTGGWRGWLSVISRAPQDGLGIAVFTNWDEGATIMTIIKYRLYEKALGLPHVDWSSRLRSRLEEQMLKDKATTAARSSARAAAPTHSIESFVGTYSHSAYGVYEICKAPSGSYRAASSPRCRTSDAYWNEVKHANASFGEPSLGIAISSVIANFIQLDHSTGNIFNVRHFEITTAPKNEDEVVVVPPLDGPLPALEFSINEHGKVDGFGMTHVWGEGNGVPSPTGRTVRERAEVWFDRVG